MTHIERLQSVADLAGHENTQDEFQRRYQDLWDELIQALTLLQKVGKAQAIWQATHHRATRALDN